MSKEFEQASELVCRDLAYGNRNLPSSIRAHFGALITRLEEENLELKRQLALCAKSAPEHLSDEGGASHDHS